MKYLQKMFLFIVLLLIGYPVQAYGSVNNGEAFNGLLEHVERIYPSISPGTSRELLQFGGGGFGGALLTTGSFTMMSATGGF